MVAARRIVPHDSLTIVASLRINPLYPSPQPGFGQDVCCRDLLGHIGPKPLKLNQHPLRYGSKTARRGRGPAVEHERFAGRAEPCFHGPNDARGDLVLDGEDVDRVLVESLRPELAAARHIGELRRDTQPDARGPYAALENVAHQ